MVRAGRRPLGRSAAPVDDVAQLRRAEGQRADAERAAGSRQRAAVRRRRRAGGDAAAVDATPFVTNPGYATPQGDTSETYYYTARDAFRTEDSRRTDFAANYSYGIGAGSRKVDLFVQAQVLNIFNTFDLCGCGATRLQQRRRHAR